MGTNKIKPIQELVDQEIKRSAYPEGIPYLPPVPSSRYTDPQFYELEKKEFWPKTWLHVGFMSQLPEPGSYRLFEQLDLSVIIHRGSDNRVRAFHNICLHRGSPLVLETEGKARRFICPYHAWGYSETGDLISVPETRDFICLEKSENSLMEVRCEVLHGMIFINLDGNADPLEKTHAPIAQQLQVGNFPIGDVVVKGMITVEMDCNWKIAYDNFLEIYHVRTVHARSVARFLNSNSFSISLYENGHSRFVTRKRDSSSVFGKDAPTETRPDDFFMDYTMALPIFPNTFMPIDPIGFTCQNYWPVSPEKSMMVMYMLGWKAEGKEDEEFWAGMRAQIEGIIAEDTEIFYGLQRSMRSGLLDGIKLNAQERAIYWYHQEIDRLIGTSKLPPHLRVEPVLNPTTNL